MNEKGGSCCFVSGVAACFTCVFARSRFRVFCSNEGVCGCNGGVVGG